jgi:hypothetical protein
MRQSYKQLNEYAYFNVAHNISSSLVITQVQKGWMSQVAVLGPFHEADLLRVWAAPKRAHVFF